jgi:hypothetical protein
VTHQPSAGVRPRFVKWSVIVFVLLLPFVIHAAWDYAETWRLGRLVADIRANREPLTTQEIHSSHVVTGDAAKAARFYRAAAALAGSATGDEGVAKLHTRMNDAISSGTWPADLVADLRSRVAQDEEAFRLLDRATPLSFDGFGPGNLNARIAEMLTLARLAPLRSRLLAVEGDGRGAAASLYAELRLQRTFDFDPLPSSLPGFTIAGLADSVGLIVNRANPDAAALADLTAPLRDLDRDDRLKMHLIRTRAAIFDQRLGSWSLARPWVMTLLNERIETLGALIEGANRPWPRRLDPAAGAYLSSTVSEERFRPIDAVQRDRIAGETALIRCARLVIAVERYRLEHGHALPARIDEMVPAFVDTVPVDPFSGKPLRLVADGAGYVVYSVGWNRGDDGGRLATPAMLARRSPGMPAPAVDLGIRIAHR